MDDDAADARRNPTSTEPKSVLSGRTIKEIAEADQAGDEARGRSVTSTIDRLRVSERECLQSSSQPEWTAPMLARLNDPAFSDPTGSSSGSSTANGRSVSAAAMHAPA